MYLQATQPPSLEELRMQWHALWGKEAHQNISRKMLEKSIEYKRRQKSGNRLNKKERSHLNSIVKAYKRNHNYFNDPRRGLKIGSHIVKQWRGKKYTVTVTDDGFTYNNDTYKSLTAIANTITGKKWNGWIFFGLKGAKNEK